MGVLKNNIIKLNASTLIESLVASVIIIIIFTITSLTLNNVFVSNIRSNTDPVENRLNELEYLYKNKKLTMPYREDFEGWNIILLKSQEGSINLIVLQAYQLQTKKRIKRKVDYVDTE